jgi:hypothetical protein
MYGEFGLVRPYKIVGIDRNEITNQYGSSYMNLILLRHALERMITKHTQLRSFNLFKNFFWSLCHKLTFLVPSNMPLCLVASPHRTPHLSIQHNDDVHAL